MVGNSKKEEHRVHVKLSEKSNGPPGQKEANASRLDTIFFETIKC